MNEFPTGKILYCRTVDGTIDSEEKMDECIRKYPSSKYRFINSEGRIIDKKNIDQDGHNVPFAFIELDEPTHNKEISGFARYRENYDVIFKKEGE